MGRNSSICGGMSGLPRVTGSVTKVTLISHRKQEITPNRPALHIWATISVTSHLSVSLSSQFLRSWLSNGLVQSPPTGGHLEPPTLGFVPPNANVGVAFVPGHGSPARECPGDSGQNQQLYPLRAGRPPTPLPPDAGKGCGVAAVGGIGSPVCCARVRGVVFHQSCQLACQL